MLLPTALPLLYGAKEPDGPAAGALAMTGVLTIFDWACATDGASAPMPNAATTANIAFAWVIVVLLAISHLRSSSFVLSVRIIAGRALPRSDGHHWEKRPFHDAGQACRAPKRLPLSVAFPAGGLTVNDAQARPQANLHKKINELEESTIVEVWQLGLGRKGMLR
ncbi:MAG: hypothetical protein IT562_10570 [Alphaproteobacteria bacterium]|nr:hypothetical protein [Alphaproteobacteria bacterium]